MTKRILVTNDDGVTAPGLLALAEAVRRMDSVQVSVLAPDHNWSACGHVKTMSRPMRIRATNLADGSQAWSSDGAPSDCVALAMMGALEHKFDVVVSGINPNANVGLDVTYSGTVTAAMEAAIGGVYGVAVSLDAPEYFNGTLDFSTAAVAARVVTTRLLKLDLPRNVLLNVNIPYLPLNELKGYRISRQGLRIYRDELIKREDPRGRPYYWIGGEAPTGVPDTGTDFGDLKAGFVSITPIQLDLTAHDMLPHLREVDWSTDEILGTG